MTRHADVSVLLHTYNILCFNVTWNILIHFWHLKCEVLGKKDHKKTKKSRTVGFPCESLKLLKGLCCTIALCCFIATWVSQVAQWQKKWDQGCNAGGVTAVDFTPSRVYLWSNSWDDVSAWGRQPYLRPLHLYHKQLIILYQVSAGKLTP